MNPRMGLYELAARHRLDAGATEELQRLAGLHDEPAALPRWLPRGMAVLAAALTGFGVVLWIAANWDALGRSGQFALLQGLVLAACLGALWRPALRPPLTLLALLGIGGLFAYFGQTYQTGADPWQLFALWSLLALPLCLGARSDVLWAPWALVAMTAVSLWLHAHAGYRWRVQPSDLLVYALAWGTAAMLVAALGPGLRRFTGTGVWALRTAVTLAVGMVTTGAILGLFHDSVAPHYPLGLLLLMTAAGVLALRPAFDVYALSAVALGVNTLLVIGLWRWLFDDRPIFIIGPLLLIGTVAAGLLAASVSAILRLAGTYGATGETA